MKEADLRKAFKARCPALHAWGLFVTATVYKQVAAQIAPRQIDVFFRIPPKSRVKSEQSFLEKAERSGKMYSDPLRQITDQVGTRFVVLLTSEIDVVKGVIENEASPWTCDRARDFEDERRERPHHFDYQSVHYVIAPKHAMDIGGIEVLPEIQCEVQVRTLLQHAYAELAHDTVYKPALKITPEINRNVAKGAALIEATDDVFCAVESAIQLNTAWFRTLHDTAIREYTSRVGIPGSTDIRLTIVLLEACRPGFEVELNSDGLSSLLKSRPWIAQRIKERLERSMHYRHPSILIAYFLAHSLQQTLSQRWPFDPNVLESLFADLGISAE